MLISEHKNCSRNYVSMKIDDFKNLEKYYTAYWMNSLQIRKLQEKIFFRKNKRIGLKNTKRKTKFFKRFLLNNTKMVQLQIQINPISGCSGFDYVTLRLYIESKFKFKFLQY